MAGKAVQAGKTARANDAWEALMAAHAGLLRQFAARDIWEDISVKEYDVLYTLAKCPDPISITELIRHVLLSQPAMSRMVDRLAARGLVARAVDSRDRRGVLLSLTPAGASLQARVGRRHARDVAATVRATLTADEIRALEAIGHKLARARKL
ncbi:MAG TPA: MarR family transcriptional regulator [Trebonia sp.]|jgi:DNA-binding MarR family transcriptional regulator|nr:MarR family transcriptional regulator [Trebonia sp.]